MSTPGTTSNQYALDDRVVLVTGGGSGIGRAVAHAFLANGARVAVAGRRREPLEETLAPYDADRGLVVVSDVSEDEQAAAMVQAVLERWGRLDVVVNNAAAYANGPFDEIELATWETVRSANIDGFVHVARHALPELEKVGGNLVVVGSVSGMRGDWGQAVYNATKAAIMNFVQSLALDYGPRGVRLNAVAPALTITGLTQAVADDPEALAKAEDRIALGRPGRPEDVAPAVLWLASDDAAYVTGAWLPVDGGTTASTGQAH
ncbi:Dihydroanticapsin 7-dehydrogenase [Nocardioides aquaticus]|uniref:Dihydroanticapsin 7-dehydrogenase n=1 Tax=Nocardioides aquaticus TaxID=160826 RepID=A0ABX8EI11_9ACTN|nr:SDR family oxidoreductase [Nocardioides aquaticus]QVT80136.1 Dihydroanticapsin 7-dehydrogenase [Nocardioides aquaticus]